VLQKASDYLALCITKDNAHYLAAERAFRWHKRLGIPLVVTATVVSTSLFATLARDSSFGWKLATGIVSIVAVVLSGVQTFLNFGERAPKHVAAAGGYSVQRRRLEHFLLKYDHDETTEEDRKTALAELQGIMDELDQLDRSSPLIPTDLYEEARNQKRG